MWESLRESLFVIWHLAMDRQFAILQSGGKGTFPLYNYSPGYVMEKKKVLVLMRLRLFEFSVKSRVVDI